jgi:hypothetical protein
VVSVRRILSGRMASLALVLPVLFLPLLTTCSGRTQYQLLIDVRSFMPADRLRGATTLPTTSGVSAYMVPLLNVLADTEIPDLTVRQGLALELPVQAPPDEVKLHIEARLLLELENLSAIAPLPGATVSLYLAASSADDVYAEGTEVASNVVAPVPAGSRATIDFHPAVGQGDPGYAYLATGRLRVGIVLRIPAASGVSVNFSYDLQGLTILVSGYPFGLVP